MVFRVGPIKLDSASPFTKQEWNQQVLDQLKDLYNGIGFGGILSWNSAGNVVIAKPTSGTTLALNQANGATYGYGITSTNGNSSSTYLEQTSVCIWKWTNTATTGTLVLDVGGTTAFSVDTGQIFTFAKHHMQAPITVASLPAAAAGNKGARYFVSDANATAFASVVAGGGANIIPVYSDGTNWRIG
jgi:hypothetical protein